MLRLGEGEGDAPVLRSQHGELALRAEKQLDRGKSEIPSPLRIIAVRSSSMVSLFMPD